MNIVTKLTMDLVRPDQGQQVSCVQGDTLSRKVALELLADGLTWKVPEGTSVLISYYRPDGTCGTYEKLPDGTQAWEISGNVITITLTPQMLTAEGLVAVQLKLINGDVTISTFAFQVLVRPGIGPGDDPENYKAWLTAYLPQTSGAADGQYLQVTQVDESGRVTGVAGADIVLPTDQQARIEALEKTTAALPQLDDRVTALEENEGEVDQLGNRVAALEESAGEVQQLGSRVAALEQSSGEVEQLGDRVSALEESSGEVQQLGNRVVALEESAGEIEQLDSRVATLEEGTGEVERLGSRVTALEENAGEVDQLGNRVAALEQSSGEIDQLEDRMTGLEARVGEVEELGDRVTALEGNSGGDPQRGYPAVWDSAVEECIRKVREHQEYGGTACLSFAYFSDHHHQGGCAGGLIKKVMEECGIPFCFYCGDLVSRETLADTQALDAQIQDFNTMMAPISREKDFRALGEHDYCRTDPDGSIRALETSPVYERFFRKQFCNRQCSVGSQGSYYYVEDKFHRIRFIVMDSVNMDREYDDNGANLIEEGYGFGQEQLDWLVYEALYFQEPGWSVVFIAHSPLSNQDNSNLRDADLIRGILTAFWQNGTYRGDYSGYNSASVDVDFQDAITADLIGWFSGHTHQDSITTLEISGDPDSIEYPFNVVTITSDADDSYAAEPEERDPEGDTSHAIDFVTIDKDQRTVYLTRLGFGQDRSFPYT